MTDAAIDPAKAAAALETACASADCGGPAGEGRRPDPDGGRLVAPHLRDRRRRPRPRGPLPLHRPRPPRGLGARHRPRPGVRDLQGAGRRAGPLAARPRLRAERRHPVRRPLLPDGAPRRRGPERLAPPRPRAARGRLGRRPRDRRGLRRRDGGDPRRRPEEARGRRRRPRLPRHRRPLARHLRGHPPRPRPGGRGGLRLAPRQRARAGRRPASSTATTGSATAWSTAAG